MNIHAKNIFWVYFFTFLAMPLGYLIRVMYAQNLSVEDYGVFYGLFGFFAVFEVVRSWALPSAINFFTNKHLVKEEFNQVKTLFWFGHGFRFLLSLLIGGLLYIFRPWIFQTFYPTEAHIGPMFNLFLLYWIVESFFVINNAFLSIFQNQKINGIIEFLKLTSVLIFSVIGFRYLSAYQVPVLAYFLAVFFVVLLAFGYIFKTYFQILFKSALHKEKGFLKKIFLFATALIPASFANTIFVTTDTIMIQYFEGAKDVALYTTAVATSGLLLLFFTPLGQVLNPLISKLWHQEKKLEISKIISLFLNHIFILFLPLSLFVALFSKNILLSLFGEKFVSATIFLTIFTLVIFFKALRMLFAGSLTSIGKTKEITKIIFITGLFNVIGNLILIQFWGTLGVVITTAISFVLAFLMFLSELHKVIPLTFDLKYLFKTLLLSLVFIGLVFILKNIIYFQYFQKPLWNFAFNGGIIFVLSGSVYVGLLFWTGVLNRKKLINLKRLLLEIV